MNSGPFTQTDNAAAEAKIAGDLRQIVAAVTTVVPPSSLLAMLLTGGFGRGEGSVRTTAAGVRVMNDYDLALVPRTAGEFGYVRFVRRWQGKLEALAGSLARDLGVKQVDLTVRPHRYFRRPPELRIENYEVRQGNRLLWGKTNPCAWMPDWQAADLPLFDGIWLFRNRGLGLLLARLYLELSGGSLAPGDRENFFIECNKARLAMGDACLLARHSYHHLYRERLRRALSLATTADAAEQPVLTAYAQALEQKLWTQESHLSVGEPLKAWSALAQEFSHHFLRFETLRLGVPFTDWCQYAQTVRPESRILLRSFVLALVRSRGRHLRLAAFRANRGRNIEVIGLLLEAATQPGLADQALRQVAQTLGRPAGGDWQELVLAAIHAVHPGGEMGRVLRRFSERTSRQLS